jgi:hypothetical protein
MTKPKLLFLLLAFSSTTMLAQVLYVHSNLPPILQANAGMDNFIDIGDSVQLGGEPVAWDGYGNYVYLWEPASGLEDPTLPNPWAKPDITTTYVLMVSDGHNCFAMDETILKVGASGVNNPSNPFGIKIYPNPSSNFVNVSIKGVSGAITLRIRNRLGQVLIRKEVVIQEKHQFTIDVHAWSKGVYYLSIQSDRNNHTKPLIVL